MGMRRRGVGRSLVRATVGTAVIAGTAGAVHHHQDQRWAKQEAEQAAAADQQAQEAAMQQQLAEQQAQIDQMQQQQAGAQQGYPPPGYPPQPGYPPPGYPPQPGYPPPAYAPPPPPAAAAAPAAAEPDLTAKLQQLGELRASGILTDEEFAAAKQKLLSA